MLRIIIEKEVKHLFQSPKFISTFLISVFLLLLSVMVGILDYKAAEKQYSAAVQLNQQKMTSASSWGGMSMLALRRPDPMQIFITGVQNDIGRFSRINSFDPVRLTNSSYSDDPIFAVFRFLDMTFIFQIILSLFAILFTYDAINGEREQGTLKLIFSGAVSKVQFLLGKFLGAILGLVIPLLIPLMVIMLLIPLFDVPFTFAHWLKLIGFIGISFGYLIAFITLGLFISTVTRESATSFLVLLVIWVAITLIIPRASLLLAGKWIAVPSVAEIDGQADKFSRDIWNKHEKQLAERWQNRSHEMSDMSKEERQAYRDEHMWDWMVEDDEARSRIQKEISAYVEKLNQDLRNQKRIQEKFALTLARLSPASAFQLAAMEIAGTDIDVKNRSLDRMNDYRKLFVDFIEKKQKESGGHGGIQISISSDGGFNVSTPRSKGTLDISGIPQYVGYQGNGSAVLNKVLIDIGILICYMAAFFMGAMICFIKYDVR